MSIALAIAALAPVGASQAVAAEPAPGPAGWLFDPGTVVEIDLDLPQASVDVLKVKPEEEYQPATFSLTAGEQTFGPLSVGARLKGGLGSFRPLSQKAAFKLKFDEFVDDQTFFGLEKLTLNNMVQDPSMLHETLAYEAFRAAGVAAPRTGYAFLRVNGEPYGLYLNVEALDSVALPRWFASTLHLYEGAYGADVAPGSAAAFEVDEGKSKKREDLEALIVAANDEEGDWSEGMSGFADLDQMTLMWAVERYIGHWDGYSGVPGALRPNNYYLHSEEDGEFRMLPWGTDQTWGSRLEFDEGGAGVLFERCLADASCAAAYRDALQQVGSAIAALGLDSRVADLAERLAPCQALEDPSRREFTAAEIATGVAGLREFVAARPGELAAWLGQPVENPPAEGPPSSPEGSSCQSPALPSGGPAPEPERQRLEPPGVATGRSLRVGMPRAVGTAIATPVVLPLAGSVTQRVAFAGRAGRAVACVDREASDRAGRLTLRCGLSAAARRRLASGPLTLTIRIGFAPLGGSPELALRHLTLPRR